MPGAARSCVNYFLYYTAKPCSTELKVNTTNAVTVCLFRIFTNEQINLQPVTHTVAKHSVVWTVLEDSCGVILQKQRLISSKHCSRPLCLSDQSLVSLSSVSSRTTAAGHYAGVTSR